MSVLKMTLAVGLAAALLQGCNSTTEPIQESTSASTPSSPTTSRSDARSLPAPKEAPAAASPAAPPDLPPIPSSGVPELPSSGAPPAETASSELSAAFNRLFSPATDGAAWEAAQEELIQAGPKAVPLYLRELQSGDVARREQASSLLVLLGSSAEGSVPALKAALNDSSSFVRANAAAALSQFPGQLAEAKEALVVLLQSEQPELRRLAATNLSLMGETAKDLVPRLTLALDDSDEEVVRPIVRLLGEIGPAASEALPRLQRIAFETKGDVQQAAEQAMQKIEARPLTPPPVD